MRKFNYRSSNKNKKSLKYGGYASITTIILVTALVLVNVLFSLLGWKVDLTVQKLYTPGDITTEIIESLDEDITIYGLYNTGTEDNNTNKAVITLLEEYCNLSEHLSFATVDPLTDPAFASQYLADSSLDNGSLIVVNEETGKNKTIPVTKMYQVETDYEYLRWISDIKHTNTTYRLIVMGHSLDVTDKDIILDLFKYANEIIILYHSDEAKASYIANLITLYGKDGFDLLRKEQMLTFLPLDSDLSKLAEKMEQESYAQLVANLESNIV